MFAIVTIGGNQYKVSPGSFVDVPQLQGKVGDKMTLNHVLVTQDKAKIKVGKPAIKGVVVTAKIISQGKGEKIYVRRFKSKVRYRKSRGFRPKLTRLEILSVGTP